MFTQPNEKVLRAIESLNRDLDFQIFKEFLSEQIPYFGAQTVNSSGEAKIEYSGAYKTIEALVGILSLERSKAPPEINRRFE